MGKIIKNQGNKGFTTMFNDHFHDRRLSWAAVGMLSNVFSLPDDWEFSIKGFMEMHSDGQRGVTTALYELEWFGYLERIQVRDTKGKLVDFHYEFFNESQLPNKTEPVPAWKDRKQFVVKRTQIIDIETGEVVSTSTVESPCLQNVNTDENEAENPYLQNAHTGNAHVDFAPQLNNNILNTYELNTNKSINLSNESYPEEKKQKHSSDRLIDRELVEKIKKQIEYDILGQTIAKEDLDAAVDAIAALYMTTEPQDFNGISFSPELIRSRAEQITSEHVEYVFNCFYKNRTEIKNIVAYFKTAMFNAPVTIGVYYSNAVRADQVV